MLIVFSSEHVNRHSRKKGSKVNTLAGYYHIWSHICEISPNYKIFKAVYIAFVASRVHPLKSSLFLVALFWKDIFVLLEVVKELLYGLWERGKKETQSCF